MKAMWILLVIISVTLLLALGFFVCLWLVFILRSGSAHDAHLSSLPGEYAQTEQPDARGSARTGSEDLL